MRPAFAFSCILGTKDRLAVQLSSQLHNWCLIYRLSPKNFINYQKSSNIWKCASFEERSNRKLFKCPFPIKNTSIWCSKAGFWIWNQFHLVGKTVDSRASITDTIGLSESTMTKDILTIECNVVNLSSWKTLEFLAWLSKCRYNRCGSYIRLILNVESIRLERLQTLAVNKDSLR